MYYIPTPSFCPSLLPTLSIQIKTKSLTRSLLFHNYHVICGNLPPSQGKDFGCTCEGEGAEALGGTERRINQLKRQTHGRTGALGAAKVQEFRSFQSKTLSPFLFFLFLFLFFGLFYVYVYVFVCLFRHVWGVNLLLL